MPFDHRRKFTPSNGKRPVILVTNDDGIHSDGLKALAKALRSIGRVVVVAPTVERSATSHALTLHRPLRVNRVGNDVYSVDGTPTDCVNLGVSEILKGSPSLLFSGINCGANLGDDVHYSGTVAAAMEGGILGIPSVAISLHAHERFMFGGAASFAATLAKKLLKTGLPKGIILNVNVPNRPPKLIKGFQIAFQGKRRYGDIVVEKTDPRGRKYYWIGGDEEGFEDLPGSDCNAVLARYISITPIRADLTAHSFLKTMRQWRL